MAAPLLKQIQEHNAQCISAALPAVVFSHIAAHHVMTQLNPIHDP